MDQPNRPWPRAKTPLGRILLDLCFPDGRWHRVWVYASATAALLLLYGLTYVMLGGRTDMCTDQLIILLCVMCGISSIRLEHRSYAVLPTSAQDRGRTQLLHSTGMAFIYPISVLAILWALGAFHPSRIALSAGLLLFWSVLCSLAFLGMGMPDRLRFWRGVVRVSLRLAQLGSGVGALALALHEGRPGSMWALNLAALLVAVLLFRYAWRHADTPALQAATRPVPYIPRRFRFLFRDISVLTSRAPVALSWVVLVLLSVSVLGALFLFAYGYGDLRSWRALRESPVVDFYAVMVCFGYCMALFGVAQNTTTLRTFRALPLSSRQVHWRLVIGSGTFSMAVVLVAPLLFVGSISSILIAGAFAGACTAAAPWRIGVHVREGTNTPGCLSWIIGGVLLIPVMAALFSDAGVIPSALFAVVAAVVGAILWQAGRELIIVERVTPRDPTRATQPAIRW